MKIVFLLGLTMLHLHAGATEKLRTCVHDYGSLQVQVSLEQKVAQIDAPIPVVVTLHNNGKHALRLRSYMQPVWHWLNFEVIGPAGEAIPYTGPEYKIIDDESRRLTLDPGYFWGRRIANLRTSYNLTKPGRYKLRAIYGGSPDGQCKHAAIASAPVSFQVK